MLTCGKVPKGYWCRPSRHWTISDYHGAKHSEQCGDQYLGHVMAHAGEGFIHIDKKAFTDGVGEYKDIHIICKRGDHLFFYIFYDNGGGRYGLVVHDANQKEVRNIKTHQEWLAKITPEMLAEFHAWLSEIMAQHQLPKIVRGTLRYWQSKKGELPGCSGE